MFSHMGTIWWWSSQGILFLSFGLIVTCHFSNKIKIKPSRETNVWCRLFRSKHSTVLLLCLLRNSLHQTLCYMYICMSVEFQESGTFFPTRYQVCNYLNVCTFFRDLGSYLVFSKRRLSSFNFRSSYFLCLQRKPHNHFSKT